MNAVNIIVSILGSIVALGLLAALFMGLAYPARASAGGASAPSSGGSFIQDLLKEKWVRYGLVTAGVLVAVMLLGIIASVLIDVFSPDKELPRVDTPKGGDETEAGVQTQPTAYPFWLLATSMLGVVGVIAAFVWLWRTSSKDELVSRLLTTSLIIAVAVLGLWGLSQISWKGVENITFPAIEDEAGNVVFLDQTFDWATAWLWEKRFQLLALAVMAVFLYGSWSHFLNGSGSGARLLVSTTVAIAFFGLGLYMVAQGLLGENGAKTLQDKLSEKAVAAVESIGTKKSGDDDAGARDDVPPVPDAKPDERRGAVDDRNFLDKDFGRVRAGWETPDDAWIKHGDVISVTLEGPGCFWTNLEEDVLLLDQTMFPYVTFSLIKGEGQRTEQVKPRPIEIEARPSGC